MGYIPLILFKLKLYQVDKMIPNVNKLKFRFVSGVQQKCFNMWKYLSQEVEITFTNASNCFQAIDIDSSFWQSRPQLNTGIPSLKKFTNLFVSEATIEIGLTVNCNLIQFWEDPSEWKPARRLSAPVSDSILIIRVPQESVNVSNFPNTLHSSSKEHQRVHQISKCLGPSEIIK